MDRTPFCDTPNTIHLPLFLDIPTVSLIYLQCPATSYAASPIKADTKVQAALNIQLERQGLWIRNISIAILSDFKFRES